MPRFRSAERILSIIFFSTSLISVFQTSVFAQASQAGSVNIEEFSVEESNATRGKRQALEFFGPLHDALAAGNTPVGAEFDDATAAYMAASYLQCSIKRGVCVEILDAIVESDVILSKLRGKAQCPNLKRGWAAWVNLDMEKRLSLGTPIGLMQKIAEFNSRERRKYLHCEETVAALIPKGALTDRYTKGSEALRRLEVGEQYIAEIAKRVPNLFGSLGLSGAKKEEK